MGTSVVNLDGFPARTPPFQEPNSPQQWTKPWFLWLQGLISTGLIAYGLTEDRPATSVDASLFVETDRGNVVYQWQNGEWQYIAGVMVAPYAEQPTDLAGNDAGFLFIASDTLLFYYWTGTIWQQIASGGGGGGSTQIVALTLAATTTNITTAGPVAPPASNGLNLMVQITESAGGGDAITWGSSFESGVSVNIQEEANAVTRVLFVSEGGVWVFTGMVLL